MQSSNDHRPCERAGSTETQICQIYIYIRTRLFIQVICPWGHLYNCGRPGSIQAFFVWWVRFCNLSSLGTTSQFSTELRQSLHKQSELPHKDNDAKNLNLSLSNVGKDHKTSIGDNLIWLQTFVISSSDQSLQLSTQALQQRVVRTEYHLRWRPWLQVNVNIVLSAFLVSDSILTSNKFWHLLFWCLIISRLAGQPKAPPSLGGKGGIRQSGASSCHPEVRQ